MPARKNLPQQIILVPSIPSYSDFDKATAQALKLPVKTKLPSKPNSRVLSLLKQES